MKKIILALTMCVLFTGNTTGGPREQDCVDLKFENMALVEQLKALKFEAAKYEIVKAEKVKSDHGHKVDSRGK